MHVLTAEQIIIDKITAEVSGFTTISNPSLLAGLHEIDLVLPACIIMPGMANISSQQANSAGVIEEQDWHVIIIVAHQATDSEDGKTEDIAGTFMQACIKALSGWYPGPPFLRSFIYEGRAAPEYNLSYAEFPLLFKVKQGVIL
jgi:hypothetical protein